MKSVEYKEYNRLIQRGEIYKALEFRHSLVQDYLYKFFPITSEKGKGMKDKRTFNMIKNNMVWISRVDYLNDPYEGKGISLDFDKFEKYGFPKKVVEYMENVFTEDVGLCCFSTQAKDNISMWAYYASCHKGFCIKYKVNSKNLFYDVNYIKERKLVCNSIIKLLEEAKNSGEDNCKVNAIHILLLEKYFTKHISWSNEKEYRCYCELSSSDKKGKEVGCKELGIEVEEIYTGINCSPEIKQKLRRISKQIGNVKVIEGEIDDRDFIVFR